MLKWRREEGRRRTRNKLITKQKGGSRWMGRKLEDREGPIRVYAGGGGRRQRGAGNMATTERGQARRGWRGSTEGGVTVIQRYGGNH